MPEIKSSSTEWDTAEELAEWENQYMAVIRLTPLDDFEDAETVSEQPIRLTYMGAGPAEDVDPRLLEDDDVDVTADQQVTAWRLRYPEPEKLEVSTGPSDGNGQTATFEGSDVEIFRSRMYVRPGVPAALMLGVGAIWCQGFQVGKRRMETEKRRRLFREFHELLDYALGHMPSIQATPGDNNQDLAIDVRGDVLERLGDVQDDMASAYHLDLPPFTIEGEEKEADAPAPRPETEEMDPNPFQGSPPMTSLLAGQFSTTAIDVLREAEGKPAPTYEGEWGEDSTGHPIRVEQLGNPYEGRATFKVQAFGEPDPTAVEASMGWKMLDRMDMDTVWLHLLLLGYASATHRRGDRPVIRIPRRTVEKVFGYRNDNYTMEERAKKIRRHVEALQSIFVQFQEVRRHGDKLHFRGDMTSGAPLWGLRMVAKGQQDLFTGETVADWHLEAREGMWAEEFLHSHGGQWAQLPKEWFEQIDRRGSRNFAQRLAVYLLFQFRINAENDNRVTKQAQTLLEVCGEDMSEPRSSKRRSELKRCLSNALDTLERDYGIEVHAGRVHMDETKGMDFDTWKKRAAAFDPPPAMDGRLFQNAEGEAPPLPDVAGDWKPKQIRHLRTEVLDETQPEFGDRLDVSKQYVSQLERGTSEPSARVRKVLDGLQARHE